MLHGQPQSSRKPPQSQVWGLQLDPRVIRIIRLEWNADYLQGLPGQSGGSCRGGPHRTPPNFPNHVQHFL